MAELLIKTSDGHVEKFDKKQIVRSLLNDNDFLVNLGSESCIDLDIAKNIASRVTRLINKMDFSEQKIISSDTLRGLVTTELMERELFDLVNITEIVGLRTKDIFDITKGNEDNDNANLTPNPETSHKLTADKIMKNYYLRMIDKKLSIAHLSGLIHIHDLEYFGTRPFCRSWDLRKFFYDGFSPDSDGNSITASAPKHAQVAILQATKALAMGQCNHAGGQGLLYGTVFLAPYMKDKPYAEIKQLMQLLLFELNQMYISRGGQVIFSSINVSPGCPKVLEDVPVVHAGKIYNGKDEKLWTYKECEREIRLQFKALMELSLDGDSSGKLFPFPKIEVAIEKKFLDPETWEKGFTIQNTLDKFYHDVEYEDIPSYKDLYKMAFEVTARFGILYFDNLLPEKKNAEEGVGCTQCCSYSFATDKESDNNFVKRLNFEDGYFFNNLGGMQACSMNLPRLAFQSNKDKKLLMAYIFNTMDLMVEVFKTKKELINGNIHRLKYVTQTSKRTIEMTDFDSLVYEVGIVGLNEMCQWFTGYQLDENRESVELGKFVLAEMQKYCKILSEMHNLKIVLARTPAETVAQRFAVSDLMNDQYRDMAKTVIKGDLEYAIELCKKGIKNVPIYYSNGFAPYVGSKLSILEKIRLESEFWPFVDGGAITHIWLGEENPDPDGLMDFALRVFKNTNIGYLAFTKDLSQCVECKSITPGLINECPKCKSGNLNWLSRVTGYYSEVAQIREGKEGNSRWNAAKKKELHDRNKQDFMEVN